MAYQKAPTAAGPFHTALGATSPIIQMRTAGLRRAKAIPQSGEAPPYTFLPPGGRKTVTYHRRGALREGQRAATSYLSSCLPNGVGQIGPVSCLTLKPGCSAGAPPRLWRGKRLLRAHTLLQTRLCAAILGCSGKTPWQLQEAWDFTVRIWHPGNPSTQEFGSLGLERLSISGCGSSTGQEKGRLQVSK